MEKIPSIGRIVHYVGELKYGHMAALIVAVNEDGFLPHRPTYARRWGTLNHARRAAGVPLLIRGANLKFYETMDYTKLEESF